MIPVDSSTILRIVIFSAFVGFVLFCASYATQVWLKRNRGNRWVASWVFKVGMFLVICGLLGAGGSWVLNRFVERSGIVDAGALFVVHARRDGHVVMTPRQEVGQADIIAQYHPPALDDQLKVIDSQISEAQARIETHHVRPLEIDPVLLQRQEQVRAQISQKRQFAMDFARALRELDRAQLDANAWSERERNQIGNEMAALRAALDGLQPQQSTASARMARANQLRKQGLATALVMDERSATMLALALERRRLEMAIAGLAGRLELVAAQREREHASFEAQRAELSEKAAATAESLDALETAMLDLIGQIHLDQQRAATRKARDIEVGQRQVATLAAERNRAVAAQQIVAPFAGRVVYRSPSPGLAAEGAAVLAVSTGNGFVANIAMPASEVESIAMAGPVMLALAHPVLKKFFPGTFRTAEPTAFEPNRIIATFDVQLPQDAIGLLGMGREPMKVRLSWQPTLLQDGGFRNSLLVLAAGLLLMLLDRLRGTMRQSFAENGAKKA